MKNLEIAKILNNIADILELQGVEFKPQAYRKAALEIESLSEDLTEVYQRGELEEIPGVGKNIAEKITEYLEKGKLKYYDDLKKEIDIDVEELGEIPFLGPKKIKQLYKELKIRNIKDLQKAIEQHKIQALPGFGEETEKKLLEGIQFVKTKPKRFLYAQALPVVHKITEAFRKNPAVQKIEVAGSFRRGKETIGDLDFIVISDTPEKVMAQFVTLDDVQDVLAKGPTKSSVRLSSGLQIDLRVVKSKEFGSAMNYFIGNKDHNVELRKLALKKGYTLSEYGLFKLKGKKWAAGKTEEEIYQKLGMQYIPPELRENTGEIPASIHKKLPKLIEQRNINGVFHNHTTWSDGSSSVLAMAQKAEEMGFKFISFNDHFGNVAIANPLTEKKLNGYLKDIEKVQKKVGLRVFSGVEIDILKDGTLPLPPAKLRHLDVVVASVHLATKMKEVEITKRVCSAMENYPVDILGHPTDRLLNKREPLALSLDKVFETAKDNNIFLEINSSPERMDLDGLQVKAGKERGCSFALSTDGHDPSHLPGYVFGILSARRGWLETKNVLNCWSLPKIEKALQKS